MNSKETEWHCGHNYYDNERFLEELKKLKAAGAIELYISENEKGNIIWKIYWKQGANQALERFKSWVKANGNLFRRIR